MTEINRTYSLRIRLMLVKKTIPGIIMNPITKTLNTIVQLSPIYAFKLKYLKNPDNQLYSNKIKKQTKINSSLDRLSAKLSKLYLNFRKVLLSQNLNISQYYLFFTENTKAPLKSGLFCFSLLRNFLASFFDFNPPI